MGVRAALPIMRGADGNSTLAEQLELCASYLDLMTIRLPDRLTFGPMELTVEGSAEVLPVSQAFQHRFRGM